MNILFRVVAVWLLVAGLTACSSFQGKDPNAGAASEGGRSASYEQQGGAAVETAIWSNDPKKKTLPQAIGQGLKPEE